jgi:fumarate reductase subunit D
MHILLGMILLIIELLLLLGVGKIQRKIASEENTILISRSIKMYYLILGSVVVAMFNFLSVAFFGEWTVVKSIVVLISIIAYLFGLFNFEAYTDREIIVYRKFIDKSKRLSFSQLRYVFIELRKSQYSNDIIVYRIISDDGEVFEIQPDIPDINFDSFIVIDSVLEKYVKFYSKEDYNAKYRSDINMCEAKEKLFEKRSYMVKYHYKDLMNTRTE